MKKINEECWGWWCMYHCHLLLLVLLCLCSKNTFESYFDLLLIILLEDT